MTAGNGQHRPNILLVTTDQMRKDHIGCYGNPVIRTPNLDSLAAGGVRFERAYCNNPLCMPNRATIATGRLPKNHRAWCNGINLDESETTIAHILAAEGYRTALIGKGHLSRYGGEPGKPFYDNDKAWRTGLMSPDWNGPYYGFGECRMSVGHGHWGNKAGHYGAWLAENFPEFAKDFRYKARFSPIGSPQCYTPALPVEAYSTTWVTENARDYIRARAGENAPFLCWVSFPDPHHPFSPPEPYDSMYDHGEVLMPRFGAETLDERPEHFRRAWAGGEMWEGIGTNDVWKDLREPQLREIIARTYGMVTLIDENVGRLLATLEETGLADNTIVIFTSDHGDLMGDCGLVLKGPFLLEGLISVPMIWRVPGGAPGVSSDLFSSCDIAPTLLGILGIEQPRAMDGVSQVRSLEGRGAAREAAVVEFKSMYRKELNLRSIVTSDWKLTSYPHLQCGELYRMNAEIPEAVNLYDDPAHAAERARLEKMLLDYEILAQDERSWPQSHS